MSSPETGQSIVLEESKNENLELPNDRIEVDLGNYHPTEEDILNTWDILENTDPGGVDLKLELIEFLQKNDNEVLTIAKESKETETENNAEFKKISRLFVLRKMILGHDWRAEQITNLAHNYILEKKRVLLRQVQVLNQQPKTEKIIFTIKALIKKFEKLSELQKNLDQIIADSYPQLWETINQPKPSIKKNNDTFQTQSEPEITTEDNSIKTEIIKTDQEVIIEQTHYARLVEALEKDLPLRFRECAAEIAKTLIDKGIDFIEKDGQIVRDGKTQKMTTFTLFINPLQPEAMTNFPNASGQDYENSLRKFNIDFKKITSSPEISIRVKLAIEKIFSHGWDFSSQEDARDILQKLHTQEKRPYAMFFKKDEQTNNNLIAIEADSGQINLHTQPTNIAPGYADGTIFSSAPVFSFCIKK